MWRAVLLVAMLASAVGCGHNIGDPCQTNVDCSPTGDRFCDTASSRGYGRQENVDINSGPGNSVCIRFFTPLADKSCTPTDKWPNPGCAPDERCVCDKSAGGQCNSGGHCAPSSTERPRCQARRDTEGSCRAGYECGETGTLGAEPVPTFDDMGGVTPAKFCAPKGFSTS